MINKIRTHIKHYGITARQCQIGNKIINNYVHNIVDEQLMQDFYKGETEKELDLPVVYGSRIAYIEDEFDNITFLNVPYKIEHSNEKSLEEILKEVGYASSTIKKHLKEQDGLSVKEALFNISKKRSKYTAKVLEWLSSFNYN